MNLPNDELNDPKLREAGAAVARLDRPGAPAGLAARTVARVLAELKPVKKTWMVLRPITNPFARVSAAAAIMLVLFPMTSVDMAAPLGSGIEERIVGREVINRVEHFVDRVLTRTGPASYSQYDLDQTCGTQRYEGSGTGKRTLAKAHANRV